MERITNKHIEFELRLLNGIMDTPETTWSLSENKTANIGNIHLYDNNIVQTKNEAHGIAVLSYCKTKREAYEKIKAMEAAVRQFRLTKGI